MIQSAFDCGPEVLPTTSEKVSIFLELFKLEFIFLFLIQLVSFTELAPQFFYFYLT